MSAWNNWLMQPFTWLFYCIFQPIRFKREFERAEPLHRVVPMLRLSLPSFCVAYLLVLLVQLILHKGSVNEIANLIPIVTLTTLIGVASVTAMGIAWSVAGGIALSLAWGIANGITANLGLDIVIA